MNNKNIILLGCLIHFGLGSCGQKDRGGCQEFNDRYSKMFSK